MNPSSFLPTLPRGSRIVILRLRSLGDTVLLTPSLRMLKEWRPDLRITVVLEKRWQPLLAGSPYAEETLSPGEGSGWKKIASRLRTARALRKRRFELCVNLHGGPASNLLARLSGARHKAIFAHSRYAKRYGFPIPDARGILGQEAVHTAEHQASAFFWLGLPRREIPPAELFVSGGAGDAWSAERRRLGIAPGAGYALLHPPALYVTKAWPAERFAQLGQFIEHEAGLRVVYSCGPGESWFLDDVQKAAGRAVLRLKQPQLPTFMAAIAGARLFVGNDSGPAHIAAALRAPLVVIFGSSNSRIWRPWAGSNGSGEKFRVVQNEYACNPCPGDRCYQFASPECILSVTVDQVKAAVEAVLRSTS